jgi:glycosyltransferase involved in cell wall biosynthesis
VKEGDVEGMGEAIAKLARDPKQWNTFGRAGRSHIEEKFDVCKQVRKQIDLYKKI